jgi:heptosyltransferase-1
LKILIVKLSSLGDVVHTLAAVMDIHAHYPHAQIDWVVESSFAELLGLCPAINRVIGVNLRRWRKSWWRTKERRQAIVEFKAFKDQLRSHAYDVVIDLQGLSKSALIARLARLSTQGKRYAIGNQTEGASYEFLTRWLAHKALRVHSHVHAVERSRIICAQALGYEYTPVFHTLAKPIQNDLNPQNSHAVQFRVGPEPGSLGALSTLQVNAASAVPPNTIALIHASSRDDKRWPDKNWIQLGEALMLKGFNVALPQASLQELAQARSISNALVGSRVWVQMGLADICAHLKACVGVIGVDSGLSHIAQVLDLPLVQIYNFDTDWRTAPLGSPYQLSIYTAPTPKVSQVLDLWARAWEGFNLAKGVSNSALQANATLQDPEKPWTYAVSSAPIEELISDPSPKTTVPMDRKRQRTQPDNSTDKLKNPQMGLFD